MPATIFDSKYEKKKIIQGNGPKKIQNVNLFVTGVDPPPQNVNFLTRLKNKNVGVLILLLLLSELTKTHSCVKEIHFEASLNVY